jgi:hypothetical protein
MLRQPMLPAASDAFMVIAFDPVSRGTTADQFVVPAAAPEPPNPVAHETVCTPMLSEAVPAMVIDDAVVKTVEVEGETIVNAGAVMSGDPGGGAGEVRVTATVFDTRLDPEAAVTVMVLAPTNSGMLAMFQSGATPAAVPDAPDVADHVTEIVVDPEIVDPPVTVPDKPMLARVVVAGGAFTVSASGDGAGGGGGVCVKSCGA